MMSNLPLVLSIGANVGIAGLAYLGSRQQNETARHSIDAEAKRARQGRAEEHFRHRQAVYHDYLDTVRTLGLLVAGPLSPEAVHDWQVSYEHRLNAVVLFGPDPVQQAAETYHKTVEKIGTDEDGGEVTTDSALLARYESLESELAERFRAVLAAMRADITAAAAVLH